MIIKSPGWQTENQPMNASTNRLPSAREKTRAHLEAEKHRIYEEIRTYPRPIPACHQHFNYLLQERRRVCLELDLLAGRLPHSPEEGSSPEETEQRSEPVMAEVKRARVDQMATSAEWEFLGLIECEARWENMHHLSGQAAAGSPQQQELLDEARADYLAGARCAAGAYRRRFGELFVPNLPLQTLEQLKEYCLAVRSLCVIAQQSGQDRAAAGNILGLARRALAALGGPQAQEAAPASIEQAANLPALELPVLIQHLDEIVIACD
jgi:hypothetical protein